MNDLAKITDNRRRVVIDLSEALLGEGDSLRVRREGRVIVLEPVEPGDEVHRIAPGTYTRDSLPPLSEGAKAIIASIDAVAPFVDVSAAAKSGEEGSGITLEDEGLEGIDLSDEGLPGLDPDD
ncbi:MAG TPA: hypothetical protein VF645_00105 [Allosphingosinicella sp.]